MKKEKNSIGIIACIVSIIIIVSAICAIFYLTNNDINYGILLIDRDVPVGNNITLAYDIKNGMFAPSVSDVCLDIWVYHLNDTLRALGLLHYYIPIYDLNREGQIKDQVNISAYCLDSGEYMVHTDLIYTTDMNYYKHLEIEFEIY